MNTVRARLLGVLSIASLVPLVTMFFVVGFFTRSALQKSEEAKISETGRELAQHISAIMDGAKNDLESLKTNPILIAPHTPTEEKMVEMYRLVSAYDSYTDLSLYDPSGYLIDSTTDAVPTWREYTQWFKDAIDNKKSSISPPGKALGQPGRHLKVYLPLIGETEVNGVIVARLSFSRVSDMLSNVRLGKKGFVCLMAPWGELIVDGRDREASNNEFKEPQLARFLQKPIGSYIAKDGIEYLYKAQKMTSKQTGIDQEWTLLAFKPMDEVAAIANKTQMLLLAALGGSIFVVAIIGLKFSNLLSKPLAQASDAAERVAGGDLTARILEAGPVELKNLAHSFNLMVAEVSSNREQLEATVDDRTRDLQSSQKQVERSASQLRAAFNATREGILVSGEDGSIITINRRFYAALGLDAGTTIDAPEDLRHQLDLALDDASVTTEQAWDSLLKNRSGVIEEEWNLKGGSNRVISVYSAPIYSSTGEILGRISVIDDLSDKRQLEESMRQAQKMEAVGQMAGGVAHDFNNVLTGIIGHLSLVEMDLSDLKYGKTREHISMARQAGDRAADLVKKLLGFSRRSNMNLTACDVNDIVKEARGIVLPSLDPRIKFAFEAKDNVWGIVADDTLLSQVIVNLCVNARDAMPDGGVISIRTNNRSITKRYLRSHPDATEGEHVCITIEDTGTGMSKEVSEHVFEPFFTTKEPGKGTGLGLATSFGIIKQLGGWITLDSKLGRGTRFELFIPRSITAEAQPKVTNRAEIDPDKSKNETVLLVDDEFIVRKVAETILTKLGYKVIIATHGAEALQIYKQREKEIDMIVLDLTMPILSGKETFKHLRAEFDYVPVMICSGYLLDITEFEKETGGRLDGFVQKPYNIDTMAKTLREVLDSPRIAA